MQDHRYTYPTVIPLPPRAADDTRRRFDDLPARCDRHADGRHPTPCGACMRAQQRRLQAHYEASVAAARAWQRESASYGVSAFS
jgi:hypothetical protein